MSTEAWAPRACTLPTAERPFREAEFAELLAAARGVERTGPTALRLTLEPVADVAAKAADLVTRETACCSFFTFALVANGDGLRLEITVPEAHAEVLDGLAAGRST
ncbi:hypothetical protein ACQPZF_15515 [Actinosynnema sp. CS-041913]|uniref:hypothetical protein n=1 Tax=Actinosynnema sp. CS-041913 TaxID=3239917 RepID=UPI003D8CC7DE